MDGADRGWTVFEIPSTPGSCQPLDLDLCGSDRITLSSSSGSQAGAAARELNAMPPWRTPESQAGCTSRAWWTTPAEDARGIRRQLVPRRRRERFFPLQVQFRLETEPSAAI